MKPSTKAPAKTPPKAPPAKPAKVEAPKADGIFDDEDGTPPGAEPSKSTEGEGPPATARPNAEPAAPETPATEDDDEGEVLPDESPAPTPEPAPTEPAAEAEATASPQEPRKVRLGQVEGLLHRVPVAVIMDLLGDGREKIARLQGSQTVAAMKDGVRASDGECAPVIMTMNPDDRSEPPKLFTGSKTIACASDLGMETVPVITVAVSDAGVLQTWLANRQGHPNKPECDEGKKAGPLFAPID